MAQEKIVGYADFIKLFKVRDPQNWLPGIIVKPDGVWVVPPRDDDSLTPGERAFLSDHIYKDLSRPALPFPGTYKQLDIFLSWLGHSDLVLRAKEELGELSDEPQSKKWKSGKELISRWGRMGFELFDFMKQGLQAYTRIGKKNYRFRPAGEGTTLSIRLFCQEIRHIGNMKVLSPKMSPPYSEGEIIARAKSAFNSQPQEVVNPPKDCKLISFTIPEDEKKAEEVILRAMSFFFKMEDVLSFEREHGIIPQVPPVLSTSPTLPPSPDDKDNIISTLKQSGTPDVAFPKRSWFTVVDLSRRWKISEADVEHLIETGRLKAELRQGSMADPPTESHRLREHLAFRTPYLPGPITILGSICCGDRGRGPTLRGCIWVKCTWR